MKLQTESQLVKDCLQWLALHGIYSWRNNTGAFAGEHRGKRRFVRFGHPGSADILGILAVDISTGEYDPRCLLGRFLAVEVKVKPNRPTPAQLAFLDAVNTRGGLGILVYSLEDLERAVKPLL